MSEYRKYHASKRMKQERALRNKNRRSAIRKGIVKKGDDKHIDHKNGNPRDNSNTNIRIVPKSKNRGDK